MAFSRAIHPGPPPNASTLTAQMAGIGMNFAVVPNTDPNIENTLIYASEVGMDGDFRVLAVLTTWMGIHHRYVNANRLVRVVASHSSNRASAFWSAIASWLSKDRRLIPLIHNSMEESVDLLPVGTAFQIARRGEDERFRRTVLRVPVGTLRHRESDVLTPAALVQLHSGYRNRVLMGPSWRADVWTILEQNPTLSVADVARRAYCSFATAWYVVQDFKLLGKARDAGRLRSA